MTFCPFSHTLLHHQIFAAGHFLLTHLLLDQLKASPSGGRIVNVMANVYRLGEIVMDDLHFDHQREYKPGEAYAQSKLAQLMGSRRLAKHLESTYDRLLVEKIIHE